MSLTLRNDRASWKVIGDEAVCLDLGQGTYFSTEGVGAAIVERLLQADASPEQLLEVVLATFEIDEATAKADLDAFLGDLRARELLEGA